MTVVANLVSHPGAGCLVEYMQANQPVLAYVLDEQSGRLRLFTENKRETKLPASRLLPWAGPALAPGMSRNDMEAALADHGARRIALASEVDAIELWEMAQGEVENAPAQWFAQMIWQEPDVDHVAAMGRALLAHKAHFKFRPPEFEILEAEKVELKLAEEERKRVREKLASHGRDFLRRVWESQPGKKIEPPDEETAKRLAEVLMAQIADPEEPESAAVFKDIKRGLPDHPHLPLVLAEKWGLVPLHYNYHLARAGYDVSDDWALGFSSEAADQARYLAEELPSPEPTPFVSIDSASTCDIDDAFAIETIDNGWRLSIALACPAFGYRFDTPLDLAVRDRVTSLYLPEGCAYMLPRAMATDLYSLVAGKPRPSLVLDLVLDAKGGVVEREFRFTSASVKENATYEAAEERMAPGGDMEAAYLLAVELRQRRIENGAVVVERPDPEVSLSGDGPEPVVEVVLKEPTPRAQLAVSEFMILANESAAVWGAEKELPLLYRTQDIALPPEYAGIWSEPNDIFQVVKQLGATIIENTPKPHRGLGITAYAPVTSPLRRYVDLINSAQIHAWLTTGKPRFDAAEIEAMLPRISARADAVGQVQRFRPRYWKLLHVKQRSPEPFKAVVVDDAGPLVMLALPDLQIFVRAPRDMLGDKIFPGQHFDVVFGRVDPLTNEIRVKQASERFEGND